MPKAAITVVALLCLALASAAQAQAISKTVGFRYSEQVSNAPAGACGCFGLQGAAGDLGWNLKQLGGNHGAGLGLAADVGVEHTGSVNGASYGLTLTTLTAGPRFMLPGRKLPSFAQALFGFAHGSGSAFPQNNTLVSSANSFALDLGAGADYSLDKRLTVRLLQLDYLRTSLPNVTTNWQNNLRIGAGLTLHFAR
jgi:hypothetical protein